ncbi:hypothetical protein GCM10027200_12210 [Lentzea nigeriaca]
MGSHRLCQRGVEFGEDAVAVLPQAVAGAGQGDVAGGPFHEPHAETPFELVECARESGLRDVQRLRGRRDRPVVADGGQRAEVTQLDIHNCRS